MVRAALERTGAVPADLDAYADGLGRRLAALRDVAAGGSAAARALALDRRSRALARRLLRPVEGTWHDGDENRIRGYLDKPLGPRDDPRQAAAQRLLAACDAVGREPCRPETIYFLLWMLESLTPGLAG